MSFVALGGAAAQADVFAVGNIEVDATAGNVSEARQAALAEGQRLAFDRLMQRMVLEPDWPSLTMPARGNLQEMISDFSVADERTSDVRYLATLTYRFVPSEVRRYLRQSGVDFAQTQSKPLLVVPLYTQGGEVYLWEEPNPWRTVWTLAPPNGGLVPFETPFGDLGDLTAITANQALQGDAAGLSALAERYGVSEVLVTLANVSGDPAADQASITVSAARQGVAEQAQDFSFRLDPIAGESFDDQLLRAAEALSAAVQEDWKERNLLVLGQEGIVDIRVPVATLDEWLTVKRKLEAVPLVQNSRLVVLRRYEALISVLYLGDLDQLARAFAQQDLQFALSPTGDIWELRLRTAATAPVSEETTTIE